eukprot:CAMPEP_0175240318 /NCGR_PEP_ID=MMETSP0093-20121207/29993_1 /TAXON_ID=311494 /ORGANISM="Alexandrium monilatum, Strain CCMP3105" /LENGTH=137 /DNA_ID=CAMNT_0016534363 /DNA_START=110 /DNA_END=523 /DNA_ORIENTATION=-
MPASRPRLRIFRRVTLAGLEGLGRQTDEHLQELIEEAHSVRVIQHKVWVTHRPPPALEAQRVGVEDEPLQEEGLLRLVLGPLLPQEVSRFHHVPCGVDDMPGDQLALEEDHLLRYCEVPLRLSEQLAVGTPGPAVHL